VVFIFKNYPQAGTMNDSNGKYFLFLNLQKIIIEGMSYELI